jgi:hypothetical protein
MGDFQKTYERGWKVQYERERSKMICFAEKDRDAPVREHAIPGKNNT